MFGAWEGQEIAAFWFAVGAFILSLVAVGYTHAAYRRGQRRERERRRPALVARFEHPSSPPDPAAHRGDGSFLTLQVGDADAEYERLLGTGLRFDLPLTDEPWGQRRFGLTDPSGMWVDVVEQTEPLDGWWDQYLA
ncbi:MAG TPA: VOC family protein, partial [Jiangellaceae bacterium]|nr:VOC family protein [Jiangellaceae bacterium]